MKIHNPLNNIAMKEKARREHIVQFNIAGFSYYNGAFIFSKLKIGTILKLVPEFDNPFDKHAIALYLGDEKIGFIPRNENYIICKFLKLGYNIFTAVVQQVDPHAKPEQQVMVSIFIEPKEQT